MERSDIKEIIKDTLTWLILIMVWFAVFSALAFGIAKVTGKV